MSARNTIAVAAALLFAGALPCSVFAAEQRASIPDLAPNGLTSWVPDRRAGDEFLPPPSGPGPIVSEKNHP
jgi:hypothetical protein